MKQKLIVIFIGIVCGSMLNLSYDKQFAFLVFICLTPLLVIANRKGSNSILAYCSFLLSWLIYNYQFLFSFEFQKLNMVAPLIIVPLLLVHLIPFVILKTSLYFKTIIFALVWLIVEYFNSRWLIKTPFSHLGLILANYPNLIQWYQLTGILGGTLWVLLINVFIAELFTRFYQRKKSMWLYVIPICLPILYSVLNDNINASELKRNVTVVGFSNDTDQGSIQQHLLNNINSWDNSDIVVYPELIFDIEQKYPADHQKIDSIGSKLQVCPNTLLAFGVYHKVWHTPYVLGVAMNSEQLQVRNKDFLVPFGEQLPFNDIIDYRSLMLDYRYEPYSQEYSNATDIFVNDSVKLFLAICYESFFEHFIKKKFKQKSPEAILITAREPITPNCQFHRLSTLSVITQSIVFQKSIIRSSWIGLTCIVNKGGKLLKSCYNGDCQLDDNIVLNSKPSFFEACEVNPIVLLVSFLLVVLLLMELFKRNKELSPPAKEYILQSKECFLLLKEPILPGKEPILPYKKSILPAKESIIPRQQTPYQSRD